MNLKELRAKGAFVSAHPVKKTITWKHGDNEDMTFDVHIKRLAFGDYERLFLADSDDRSRMARALCETVKLGDEGKEELSYKDAYQLEPSLARVLLDAVNEVNGTPKH
jgi:hypothetical protein